MCDIASDCFCKTLSTCRYTEFSNALANASFEEAIRINEELLADLYAVQMHMHRLDAAASAFRREQDSYQVKQEQLHAAISTAEQDIGNLKFQLEEARAERARQQAYEEVKERVVSVPARSATRTEMAAVEKEIADLQQQGAALDAAMARRRGQFAAILHVIEQVHAGLEQEGPEEGALPDEGGAPEPMKVD